jgi:hypothetical protein
VISSAPAASNCAATDSVTAMLNGSEPVDATNPMRVPTALPEAAVRNGTTVPVGVAEPGWVSPEGDRDGWVPEDGNETDGVPIGVELVVSGPGTPGSCPPLDEQPATMRLITTTANQQAHRA